MLDPSDPNSYRWFLVAGDVVRSDGVRVWVPGSVHILADELPADADAALDEVRRRVVARWAPHDPEARWEGAEAIGVNGIAETTGRGTVIWGRDIYHWEDGRLVLGATVGGEDS